MPGSHWGYGKGDGPSKWHEDYPIAKGKRQSPIDIVPGEALHDPSLGPIVLDYDRCTSLNISNNGHSVVVEFEDSDDRSVIQGGPLDNPYRLKQFHFHWGEKGCHGSEHTVAGNGYASEVFEQQSYVIPTFKDNLHNKVAKKEVDSLISAQLHLVHWNAVKYKTYSDASSAPDGLAVLGIFLETGDDHRWLHMITDALYMVKFKSSVTDFRRFNPKCLLPSSLHYWTYLGSLTTPPLYESVTWIVLKEPIVVSEKQLGKFRMLLFNGEEEDQRARMENNFRPPQPVKGRKVRSSN